MFKGLAADSRGSGFDTGVRGVEEERGRGGEAAEPEGALRFAQEVVGSDWQGSIQMNYFWVLIYFVNNCCWMHLSSLFSLLHTFVAFYGGLWRGMIWWVIHIILVVFEGMIHIKDLIFLVALGWCLICHIGISVHGCTRSGYGWRRVRTCSEIAHERKVEDNRLSFSHLAYVVGTEVLATGAAAGRAAE